MNTEIVKELPDWGKGDACLVRKGDEYFVVSSVYAMFSGFETLAFRCDKDAEVGAVGEDNWLEVAGGRGRSRDETIAEIDANDELGSIEGSAIEGDRNLLQGGEES